MLHLFRTFVAVVLMISAGASFADDEADRLKVARELIVANQTVKQMDAIWPAIVQAMKPLMTRGDAKIEKDFDLIVGVVQQEFEPYKAQMADDIARVYARSFTKEELEQLVVFSKSPVGQKMMTLTPTIMQAGVTIGQSYGAKASGQIAEKVKAELRKRGHNI
jgi:hypothetical protein